MYASDLTVGQVSAIIAAGIAVAKLFLPNLLAFLFVGTLREDGGNVTANAVSWSVISRFLHSSEWPVLLGSDSATYRNVLWSARILRLASLLGTLLISVAAIVTPLGLYEAIVPADNQAGLDFHYVADSGVFGQGTPPRNESLPFSRMCYNTTCPSLTPVSSSGDAIDTRVPPGTISLFSSGASALASSVSSIFDIQWRSWTWMGLEDNSSLYPVGLGRQISIVALDNTLEVVEGLVLDTVDGAIGFRNHSAPPVSSDGSTWTEDLLFIQPVTQCVNTNLTIEYTIPLNNASSSLISVKDIRIVDHGGFAALDQTFPQWKRSEAQTNPDFRIRAYQAAWLNNVFVMKLLNVTDFEATDNNDAPVRFNRSINSTIGQAFVLPKLGCSVSSSPQYVSTDNAYACFTPRVNFNLSQPFNITPEVSSDFFNEDVRSLCQGTVFNDLGNLANPSAGCGLVFGSSQPLTGESNVLPQPGSRWSKPMYSCASGVEAVIKTVTFAFNRTDDIQGLTVVSVTDKIYPSEEAKPLWAVENLPVDMGIMPPLWGLVTPEAVAAANISPANHLETLRRENLFLPGQSAINIPPPGLKTQNLPGVNFFVDALSVMYSVEPLSAASDTSPEGGMSDYTGQGNLAMARRWANMSASPEGVAKMLDLIWTDYAANVVVGTKGLASSAGTEGAVPAVTVYARRIRYDLRYAVPAVLVLAFIGLALLAAAIAVLLGMAGPAKVRRYLNASSAGRILTSMNSSERAGLLGDQAGNDEPTENWVAGRGRWVFALGRDGAARVDRGQGRDGEGEGKGNGRIGRSGEGVGGWD
ncbi:hypothetical protein QBC47DRAFT_64055 [Echria macrotheca]|uniref:Uncharacterized protein n=1 Tax=Echria macrotheca TaxID=438768 RepID=A0AAJ0B9V7_9PEZI|nr:hypothetical protein QBC47DRAFT_64055 [Echria macrotheca]